VHLANTFYYLTLLKHHGYLNTNVYKRFNNYIRPEFSATDTHEY